MAAGTRYHQAAGDQATATMGGSRYTWSPTEVLSSQPPEVGPIATPGLQTADQAGVSTPSCGPLFAAIVSALTDDQAWLSGSRWTGPLTVTLRQ